MDDREMNKRGQVTIFIIIAVFIVVALGILIYIFNFTNIDVATPGEAFTPEGFMSSCIRDSVREKSDLMITQGGFYSSQDFVLHDNVKASYLCKNVNYYEPCVNQYPLYITAIEGDLEEETREDIESCFLELEGELRSRNYEFGFGNFENDAKLKPGLIEFSVKGDFNLERNDVSQDISSFDVSVRNPLYDLALVAQEIVSQEARFCYFEYVGHNLLYNKYDIRKTTLSDSTKIYTIKEKESGKTMKIAIRGCAIPPGF